LLSVPLSSSLFHIYNELALTFKLALTVGERWKEIEPKREKEKEGERELKTGKIL